MRRLGRTSSGLGCLTLEAIPRTASRSLDLNALPFAWRLPLGRDRPRVDRHALRVRDEEARQEDIEGDREVDERPAVEKGWQDPDLRREAQEGNQEDRGGDPKEGTEGGHQSALARSEKEG